MTSISQIVRLYNRSERPKPGEESLYQVKIAKTMPKMKKGTFGPYSADRFLHSILLTTEVLFHAPLNLVNYASKGTVLTFCMQIGPTVKPKGQP